MNKLGLYKIEIPDPGYDELHEIVYLAYNDRDILDMDLSNECEISIGTFKEYIYRNKLKESDILVHFYGLLETTAKPQIICEDWLES